MLSTVMFLTGDIRTLRTARHKERSATPTTTNLFFKVINTHFLFTKCYLRSHQRNKLHWLQDETYFPSFIIKLSIYLLRKLYVQQSLSLKNELGFWNNVRCASKVLGRIRLGLLPTLLAGMERFQKTGLLVINIIKLKSFSTFPKGDIRQLPSHSILELGFSTVKWRLYHLLLEVKSKGYDTYMN